MVCEPFVCLFPELGINLGPVRSCANGDRRETSVSRLCRALRSNQTNCRDCSPASGLRILNTVVLEGTITESASISLDDSGWPVRSQQLTGKRVPFPVSVQGSSGRLGQFLSLLPLIVRYGCFNCVFGEHRAVELHRRQLQFGGYLTVRHFGCLV